MSRAWAAPSLRARLTLWHVAAMVLVLVVYAAAVFTLVQRNASQALDDRIRGDFRWASEMSQQRPDGTLTWFDGSVGEEGSPWLQVWSGEASSCFGRLSLNGCRCPKARPWPGTLTAGSSRCQPERHRSGF